MTADHTPMEVRRQTPAGGAPRRWLLLVHQLPSHPSNLRVRTWRRLQQLGAIPAKQAVYVLPDSSDAREDFEWLKAEIEGSGGQASVFASESIDAWSDDALVEEFRRSRHAGYDALSREIERAMKREARQPKKRGRRASSPVRVLDSFRQRLAALQRVDFFGSSGRDRAVTLVEQFTEQLAAPTRPPRAVAASDRVPEGFKRRLWVTRPRPGVDRMASGWLIRRFIDPEARFAFAADRAAAPRDTVPFDMFGVQFTHHGELCTFEVLADTFRISALPALPRLAAIVHDLDLKDGRFGAPEAVTIGLLIDGLQNAYEADDALLEEGMKLFEMLYRGFERSLQPSRTGAGSQARRPKARSKTHRR